MTHPEEAVVIVASLALGFAILWILAINYRRARAKLTLFTMALVLLLGVSTALCLMEDAIPLSHALRETPLIAALLLLLYLLLE